MDEKRGFYPNYNVMQSKDEWDSTTKEIILQRLEAYNKFKTLKPRDRQRLKAIASHLVFENREDILDWIVAHFDQIMSEPIGEGQRKPQVPPAPTLILQGLNAIDKVANNRYGKDFLKADTQQQFQVLSDLQQGNIEPIPEWSKAPQKELFSKLLTTVADAYYSHPTIWSEIGYGGPAYPRGYVSAELGTTDPWEPRQDD